MNKTLYIYLINKNKPHFLQQGGANMFGNKNHRWNKYDDGYEDVFEDGDFDDVRYSKESEYADGVEDAFDDVFEDGSGDWN